MKKLTVLVSAIAVITSACLSGCGGNELTLVEAADPTCTESGHSQYYADKDGKYYKDAEGKEEISYESVLIGALGHNYGAPVFSWENDYFEASAVFTCARDGSHTHTETAVITSAVTEATCADGKTVYTAKVVFEGEEYTDEKEQIISAVQEHSAAAEYLSDETNHWYECSVCHNNAGLDKHSFEWKTDKEAAETETGLRHEECSVCGYKRNENTVIPSTSNLEHYPATDSTCIKHGNIEYWEIGGKYYSNAEHTDEITWADIEKPLTEHTPSTEWQNGDGKHWHDCKVCGDPADEQVTHSFEWVTDKEATETETGLKHEECSVCKFKQSENTVIPASGILIHHEAKDSTCTVHGNIEYWEFVGKYYSDAEQTQEITLESTVKPLIPHTPSTDWQSESGKHWHNCTKCGNPADDKVNHSFEWKTDKEATETETGLKHEECTVCKYKRNENTEIPSKNTLVHHQATDSTCTEHGNIEYWEIGGMYYSNAEHTDKITWADVVKPLAAHTPESEWQNGNGKHWHNCSVCGDPAGEKQDHSYTTNVVTAPTCTEQGYTTHTCVCGESYTNGNTAALGHSYISVYEHGKFYKVCEHDSTDKTEVEVSDSLKVTVNESEYTPYTCYSTENSFVTFDAIEQLFVIHLNGTNFNGGLTINGDNCEVAVSVDAETTIASLTFKNGFRKLYIRGTHELTVTGDFSSEANTTTIECNVNVNKAIGSMGNLVIGTADNSTKPEFTITVAGDVTGLDTRSSLEILSGTMNIIQQDTGRNCGISLHDTNQVVTVSKHAALNITGFAIGIVTWDSTPATLNVYGTVNIVKGGQDDNAAIRSMIVNVGSEQDAGILYITTPSWGIIGGTLNFIKGKALIARATDDSGYAAFNGVAELNVSASFKLGMRSLSVSIFGGEPSGTVDKKSVIAYNMRDVVGDSLVTSDNHYVKTQEKDELAEFLTAMDEI